MLAVMMEKHTLLTTAVPNVKKNNRKATTILVTTNTLSQNVTSSEDMLSLFDWIKRSHCLVSFLKTYE